MRISSAPLRIWWGLILLGALVLNACGGGSSQAAADTTSRAYGSSTLQKVVTDTEAARFLTQATFGPTSSDITILKSDSLNAWIDRQLAMPLTASHVALAKARNAASGGKHQFNHSFWQKALSSPDQLRQRMAFALSEIFVVSFADGCGSNTGLGMNSYYDLLTERAFDSYRSLLEAVALHPIMGCYLSHLRNQKADPTTGRVPDENFAREVMQLFSIGLVQLNPDGTPKQDASGQVIETYTPKDIAEMARVFTGLSWNCPAYPADYCFTGGSAVARPDGSDVWTVPMVGYPRFHDSGDKLVLGKTIKGSTDPITSVRAALDILAKHPNVAPFISKQLIQRFVTSNPSPAYVARVASAFNSSNGNLGITLKAILLDEEARSPSVAASSTFGKVREPILRLSAMLRAFNASSDTGAYLIGNTSPDAYGLSQSVLASPSVFNFFRPGYTPASSYTSAAGLVAPELQLAHETSVAGYATFIRDVIWNGVGTRGYDGLATRSDVTMDYMSETSPIRKLADTPAALVDFVNQRLTWGAMSSELKTDIVSAVGQVNFVSQTSPTDEQRARTQAYRVYSAILLTMVSPDFLIQK